MYVPAASVVPTPAPARDGVARVWDHLWDHTPSIAKDDWLIERESSSPRWALITRRLLSCFGTIRGLRTIELGSGRGDLSVLLARGGAEVTLLDVCDKALVQARQRFDRLGLPAKFVQGDFHDPDALSSEAFDVSLSSGVIEHFERDDRTHAVAAHLTVLRAGGLAVVSVPNARCVPYRLWKLYLEARDCWPYGVEIPYTRGELIRRAGEAGAEQREVVGVGFWQSVGDHWMRGVFKKSADWVTEQSALDSAFGMSLILFARKGARGGA